MSIYAPVFGGAVGTQALIFGLYWLVVGGPKEIFLKITGFIVFNLILDFFSRQQDQWRKMFLIELGRIITFAVFVFVFGLDPQAPHGLILLLHVCFMAGSAVFIKVFVQSTWSFVFMTSFYICSFFYIGYAREFFHFHEMKSFLDYQSYVVALGLVSTFFYFGSGIFDKAIKEIYRQRKELSVNKVFLENILASFPNLVAYVDRNFRYQYVNAAYAKWFNIDSSKIVGQPVLEIVGEEAFRMLKPYLEKALLGQSISFEFEVPYKYGGNRIIVANYSPDIQQDGTVAGLVTFVQDVTAAKVDAARIVENEEKFRTIVSNSPMGMIMLNNQRKFVTVNDAFVKFIGYNAEELKNKTIMDVTHPEDIEKTRATSGQALIEKKSISRFSKRYITKTGEVVWGLITSQPIQDPKTKEWSLFSIIEDVTSVRLAEQKLLSASRMASLGEMASGIAHEINNPLSAIIGRAEYLSEVVMSQDIGKREMQMGLAKITELCQRISKVIRGLREFSRTADKDAMVPAKISQIVLDTLDLCREKFRKDKIELRVNCDLDVSLLCRPAQISQVLMNLLSNSYDAVLSLEKKWVEVNVRTTLINQKERLEISVTDSGVGLSQIVMEKLMQPFFTTKEPGTGTGLGLSVSKGIIEQHGGNIYYDPNAKNTRFVVELPVHQTNPSSLTA